MPLKIVKFAPYYYTFTFFMTFKAISFGAEIHIDLPVSTKEYPKIFELIEAVIFFHLLQLMLSFHVPLSYYNPMLPFFHPGLVSTYLQYFKKIFQV